MMNKKISPFFAVLLVVFGFNKANAQSGVAIALNEYCVSNVGPVGDLDNFAQRSDWVELYSNHTSAVNLSSYYLSNDRFNLFKWQFPVNYVINPGQYRVIWLTGKNVSSPQGVHTNFTIDQCKNQWLILSNSSGVIVDSIFVRHTKAGHSRGRITYAEDFGPAWRIFTTTSIASQNIGPYYLDYAPRPIIRLQTNPLATNPVTINPGGFYPVDGDQNFNIYLENGVPYDTVYYDCFNVYYTLNTGEYPVPGAPNTIRLLDSMPVISNGPAHLIRAIAVPKPYPFTPPNPSPCQNLYLPSFCETNTYFTDPVYQEFSPDFGVISLSFGQDTSWFSSAGANSPTIHVEYYDKKGQVCEGYADIKRPINEAWLTKQKGFYMTIDDRKGFGCNFEGDIFNVDGLGKTDRRVFPTLHLKAGDYESHSTAVGGGGGGSSWGTGIMDVFVQSLAAKNDLKVSPLHIKPVIAFVNGKYWGVYDLREVYDKHYEHYYNKQSRDSLDLLFYHSLDGYVTYPDGPGSNFSGQGDFANTVYTLGISQNVGNLNNYNTLFSRLDKASFIDYMILNSYDMNSNLWNYNIAFGKGNQRGLPGDKYHYYLWNMPSIFNFTALSINTQVFPNTNVSPCFTYNSPTAVSQYAGNGHGNILRSLMLPVQTNTTNGKGLFQQEYKRRYQDLLNGPLKCENLLKHYDYVKELFLKEMKYHEDPGSAPQVGNFSTEVDRWDTLTTIYRRGIAKRCTTMADGFGQKFASCYGMQGPYPLSIDVYPAGAGTVKLNSLYLDNYIWYGNYYDGTDMSLRATPSSTNYVFHHWEIKNHTPLFGASTSQDSIRLRYSGADEIVAVFTDKLADIDFPTAFSPNGDDHNDVFRPVGSALFARDFDLSIWNRWGEEVFRSTDPTVGWDGTSRGKPAQTGVYAYLVTYKNLNNESKVLKGNLTLLR